MIRVLPRLHLAGVLALLCSSSAWAAPTIIYDSGQTQPLAPYYESLRGEVPPPDTRPTPSGKTDLTAEDLLPIVTPEMRPGPVQARAINLPKGVPLNAAGARPLFLIGADSLSRRWLARHRARLKDIGAVGMLVEASTVEELQAVARIGGGLRIMPASGTELAWLYALKHYPVLIWRGRIEQ